MLTRHTYLLILSVLSILLSHPAQADDPTKHITLSAIDNEQTHTATILILREAYHRIGYTVTFELLPGKRALILANSGETDGDVARIKGTESKFQNLLPVPTPIIQFKGGVFTKRVSKQINSWSDLQGLSIGIIRGIRYSELGTKGMDRTIAHDMSHLFTLLDRNRIDVAIAVIRAGELEISENFPNSGIHLLGKPVFVAPLFHFLHKKNAQLIPLLNATFQDMSTSGILGDLYEHSFGIPQ